MLDLVTHHCRDQNLPRVLFAVLCVLIALKLLAIAAQGPNPIEMDAADYWFLSGTMMDGDWMLNTRPIAYRTPMYPWVLSLLRMCPRPLMMIVAVQSLLYFLTALIAAELATRISGFASARIFTLLVMLPAVSSIAYVGSLLTETVFVFALMLHLLAVALYAKHESAGWVLFVGLTYAITLLTRPIVMLLWGVHLVFIIILHRRRILRWREYAIVQRGRRIAHLILGGLVVAVLISPWIWRNYSMFGKPFLTEFSGRNIWIVTFQDGSGAGLELPSTDDSKELQMRLSKSHDSGDWANADWRHTWTVSKALVESGLDDAQADQLMKRVSLQAMSQDPSGVGYKTLRRMVNFWRCPSTLLPTADPEHSGFEDYPETWIRTFPALTQGYEFAYRNRLSLSIAANTILLAIISVAVVVLIFRYESRPFGVWIALILFYFCSITGIVEIPDYRYRMVTEPISSAAVGACMALFWGWIRGQQPMRELEIDG